MNRNVYEEIMDRKHEILQKSTKIDYQSYELEGLSFDYERMLADVNYTDDEIRDILKELGVGQTRLIEVKNINELVSKLSPDNLGAKIFIKDEATNASGSYKARRAALSVFHAKKLGYKGVVAATSGNYGAAVASMAAKLGLKCIIIQECYDSNEVGQPEILEKARKCESYGAEVIQTTVGPELFYVALDILDKTGYFNASLYTPHAIRGVETLGREIVEDLAELELQADVVICTNAGGGNLTGTARGIKKYAKNDCEIIAASVDLYGLHMASDKDFNKKSFTTGHTGFSIPFTIFPDRSDVPRSSARPLRYMDRHLTVTQGEVFYITEMLAQLEGLERGPAGNVSLAAAFALAQTLPQDKVIVVQETEYTGAGKHINPQLAFARKNGIDIFYGDRQDSVNGKNIVLPKDVSEIAFSELDLEDLRLKYLQRISFDNKLSLEDLRYLSAELNITQEELEKLFLRMEVDYES